MVSTRRFEMVLMSADGFYKYDAWLLDSWYMANGFD